MVNKCLRTIWAWDLNQVLKTTCWPLYWSLPGFLWSFLQDTTWALIFTRFSIGVSSIWTFGPLLPLKKKITAIYTTLSLVGLYLAPSALCYFSFCAHFASGAILSIERSSHAAEASGTERESAAVESLNSWWVLRDIWLYTISITNNIKKALRLMMTSRCFPLIKSFRLFSIKLR